MITRQQRKHQSLEVSSFPQISEPAATGKTSFLDLSAELRNQIYSICLRIPDPVHLSGNRCRSYMSMYSTFGHTKGEKIVPLFNPALLRSCKQIRDESISILYGDNIFVFRTSCDAHVFFESTPDALKHLRFIEVEPVSQPKFEIKRLLVTLKGASKLRRLTLGFGSERPNGPGHGMRHYQPEEAAKVIGPLVRHFWKQRKPIDKKKVLRLVRWLPASHRRLVSSSKSQAVRFGAEVKVLLEKTLK